MQKGRKMKFSLTLASVLLFVLTAGCGGAKATPTPDVQASAVAAASTMIAQTQAAMPTETAVPPTDTPTDTPAPSPTIPPLPTSPVFASPTVVTTTGGGACSGPISSSKGDTHAHFSIVNKTAQLVTISMQLKKNAFGDCGYWSTVLKAHGSYDQGNLPLGCYNVYTFNQSGKPDFQNFYGNLCTGFNTDKFTINVTVTSVGVVAP
jgi:hypothetical protein